MNRWVVNIYQEETGDGQHQHSSVYMEMVCHLLAFRCSAFSDTDFYTCIVLGVIFMIGFNTEATVFPSNDSLSINGFRLGDAGVLGDIICGVRNISTYNKLMICVSAVFLFAIAKIKLRLMGI